MKHEDITERKNFQKVLLDYKKASTPIYKTPRFYGVMSLAAVVVSVAVYFAFFSVRESSKQNAGNLLTTIIDSTKSLPVVNDSSYQNVDSATTIIKSYKPFINPPLANLEKKYTTFQMDAAAGGEIKYETGSTIKIPAGCFVDAKGNPVKGKVDIKYREFHDAVDFFLSGIPMTYDSGNTRYTFESAGMMDIQGFQNDEPVFVSTDKNIAVQMASKYQGNKYNLYYLDTVNRKWLYKGKDVVTQRNSLLSSAEQNPVQVAEDSITWGYLDEEIKFLLESNPIEPRLAKSKGSHFTIEVDTNKFPEITSSKDVVFEISSENKNFNPDAYKIAYTDVKLERYNIGLSYKLHLGINDSTITYIVYPVYNNKDYSKVKQEYIKKYKEYETLLAKRKAEETKNGKNWESLVAWTKYPAFVNRSWTYSDSAMNTPAMNPEYLVCRTFTVRGFGIYNCDCSIAFPIGANIFARFTDGKGTPLNLYRVYLVDFGSNALFTYYRDVEFNLKFNPHHKNVLWALTPDNEIAVFKAEDFQNIDLKSDVIKFKMRMSDAEFKNESEVRKFLNI